MSTRQKKPMEPVNLGLLMNYMATAQEGMGDALNHPLMLAASSLERAAVALERATAEAKRQAALAKALQNKAIAEQDAKLGMVPPMSVEQARGIMRKMGLEDAR